MSKLETTVNKYEVVDEEIQAVWQEPAAMGTVTISDTKDIFLVPAPSADPRDPLNLPRWRKIIFVLLVTLFSSVGLSLLMGLGGLLGFYIPAYVEAGATYGDITALMTYPTMFMGIGNLISMPLALTIGRRPLFLASLAVLVMAALLCAFAKDYNWHLGARMAVGFAAGNSEALVPMMIQEVHFIHERSTFLMWQSAGQTITSAIYILFASPIASSIGPGNWYNLGAGLAALVFVFSIFLVPETKYHRSLVAYGQITDAVAEGTLDDELKAPKPVRLSERPAFDYARYPRRTIWSDMRLFVNEPDWSEGLYAVRNTFQVLLFPNVFWAFCINGLTIGVNIAIGTTYGAIIAAPPYNWSEKTVSYVNIGQIVTALVALPMLGYGSDWVIKRAAKRNGGVHEPEMRLLPLVFPLIVGVISAVLYGQAGSHPDNYNWFIFPFTNGAYYFCFVGCNIAAITYLLDSYPTRAGPVLVVICAFRGFVSFGASYGVAKFVDTAGYDGSFGTYGGLTAALGLLGLPVFFFGKKIRMFTGRWAVKEKTGHPSLTH